MKQPKRKTSYVQACITTVSFPATLEHLYGMIDKYEAYKTDLMGFMEYAQTRQTAWWSAPKWLIKNDLMFFYHTKSAKTRVQALLKQANKMVDINLIELLNDSADLADRYAGKIFGIAQVAAPPEYSEIDAEEYHFKGRVFAPIANIQMFQHPLDISNFRKYVTISQGAITTLDKNAFDGLKKLLAASNKLPGYLLQAQFSAAGFQGINKGNWLTISTNKNIHFIHEAQVREYFINYLLKEIKDTKTPVLEECQCFRNGQRTGIADYFVKVGGHWLPVEAKLNIRSERNILAQIRQYIQVDSFTPTRGASHEKTVKTNHPSLCLVIDNSGIYLTKNGKFAKCKLGQPVWAREKLTRQSMTEIRAQLERHLSQ